MGGQEIEMSRNEIGMEMGRRVEKEIGMEMGRRGGQGDGGS